MPLADDTRRMLDKAKGWEKNEMEGVATIVMETGCELSCFKSRTLGEEALHQLAF